MERDKSVVTEKGTSGRGAGMDRAAAARDVQNWEDEESEDGGEDAKEVDTSGAKLVDV
jgi:hypothetical protein